MVRVARAEQASGRLAQHDAAGRAAGYLRFQAAKTKIVAHEDRLAALDEMIGAAHAGQFDDRFARAAEARYLRDKSPISKAKWDDTVEALRAADPAAFLEARAGLLRNSDDTYRELSTQIEQLRVAREQAIRMAAAARSSSKPRSTRWWRSGVR